MEREKQKNNYKSYSLEGKGQCYISLLNMDLLQYDYYSTYFSKFRCCWIECDLLVLTFGSDSHHRLFMIKRVNIFLLFCLSLVISKMKIITLLLVGISEDPTSKLKWAEQETTFLLYVMIQQNGQYLDQQRNKGCIWLWLKNIHKI